MSMVSVSSISMHYVINPIPYYDKSIFQASTLLSSSTYDNTVLTTDSVVACQSQMIGLQAISSGLVLVTGVGCMSILHPPVYCALQCSVVLLSKVYRRSWDDFVIVQKRSTEMQDGLVEVEKWRIENCWVCLWLLLYVEWKRET